VLIYGSVRKWRGTRERAGTARGARDSGALAESQAGESSALFPSRSGRRRSHRQAAIIQCITAQANAHLPEEENIAVSPHVLRHTFLLKLAETKGV
jgi:site-specific recombinase XerC